MIDYVIMSVRAYHNSKGKYVGTVVVIRDLNTDELFAGVGNSDQLAIQDAVNQKYNKQQKND